MKQTEIAILRLKIELAKKDWEFNSEAIRRMEVANNNLFADVCKWYDELEEISLANETGALPYMK